MAEILPPSPRGSSNGDGHGGGGNRILQIGNLHYHGNDLTELRKLAQVSPELAEKVVDQRDKEDSRANTSYRFGLGVTVILLVAILAAFVSLLIFAGILPTVVIVAGILAVALLVRVILTGQWSDTSFFGRLMVGLAKALGADVSKLTDDPSA